MPCRGTLRMKINSHCLKWKGSNHILVHIYIFIHTSLWGLRFWIQNFWCDLMSRISFQIWLIIAYLFQLVHNARFHLVATNQKYLLLFIFNLVNINSTWNCRGQHKNHEMFCCNLKAHLFFISLKRDRDSPFQVTSDTSFLKAITNPCICRLNRIWTPASSHWSAGDILL